MVGCFIQTRIGFVINRDDRRVIGSVHFLDENIEH